jgi:hypothetical protein
MVIRLAIAAVGLLLALESSAAVATATPPGVPGDFVRLVDKSVVPLDSRHDVRLPRRQGREGGP